MANPYLRYASEFARLLAQGREMPLGGLPPLAQPAPAADAPRALVFSPHPDDECIVGALALRLRRQSALRVVNVAVTQGSNRARRAARWEELAAACAYLGFDLLGTAPEGLEEVNLGLRGGHPRRWAAAVEVIARILADLQPAAVFFPHAADWNSTHVGTHHLLMDALARQPAGFSCAVLETEFWGAMAAPNLMVESSPDDVAHLMAALSFHVGEVRRNPYHLRLPAWMMDNVRRGGEVVGGQGGAAPDFAYATLYRASRWREGRLAPAQEGGRLLPAAADPLTALARG